MMARGRRQLEWDQTADLLAMLFNGFFHPENPKSGGDFNPTRTHEPEKTPEVPLSYLRHVFVGNGHG